MEHLVEDAYGLIHLIASIVALVSGTLVLAMKKGTVRHKQVGYVYVTNMGILILTAFMIYRLFSGWGVFHYAAVASLLTIGFGMVPIWTKKPTGKWKYMHFSIMYWSVIGLYAAFTAEVFTRIPKTSFFGMVGIAFIVIMLAGAVFFRKNKVKWIKIFGIEK